MKKRVALKFIKYEKDKDDTSDIIQEFELHNYAMNKGAKRVVKIILPVYEY